MRPQLLILILCFSGCAETARQSDVASRVHVTGAMRDVMWKGELEGKVALDSLTESGMYGLGPEAYLRGELLLWDGKPFVSRVATDSTMTVGQSDSAKAPFFVYAQARAWSEIPLPDSVRDIPSFETWLISLNPEEPEPFVFRLRGSIDSAIIHIQNLPPGTRVSSPEEAHQGQTNYALFDSEVDILGFFSTKHQAVFTHHDTFIHLHLMTTDRRNMGHLDEAMFSSGTMTLLLPEVR